MVSFIHVSDLHLDSPFVGLSGDDAEIAGVLRNATFQAFDNVIRLCIERSVDFLLIAGDVYDATDRSLRAQLAFRSGLQKLSEAGIRSFVVHGNHDPLDGWSSSLEWPEQVHIFGGEGVESIAVERNGTVQAIVHGISFPHRDVKSNLARKFKATAPSSFQIGLLHCNLGNNAEHENYAPCSLEDLVNTGLDYWALGHVHSTKILSESSPVVIYPGKTQARHIKESGPGGCFCVRVGNDRVTEVEFVPVDVVRWAREEINIGMLRTDEDLLTALEESITRLQEGTDGRLGICRLTLSGRGALHGTLRRLGYAEDLLDTVRGFGRTLRPLVWIDKIDIRTRAPVDIELRRQSEDIVGDVLRLFEEYRDDAVRLGELQEYLQPLYANRFCSRFIGMPDEQELMSILGEAESLCIDKLLEEGS